MEDSRKKLIQYARLKGATYASIANYLGISKQRVYQIEHDQYTIKGGGKRQLELKDRLLPGSSILVKDSLSDNFRMTMNRLEWDYKTKKSKIAGYRMISRYY